MPLESGLKSAFVLHSRPYRNNSAIVKFFCLEYGTLSGVVRGVKGKTAKNAALIQPFLPLHIAWNGRTDLKSITTIEEAGKATFLQGECLLSAFYVNEILYRLLQEGEPLVLLFGSYCETLNLLEQHGEVECILRKFEKHLLDQLGYGVSYSEDAYSGSKLEENVFYEFVTGVGFVRCNHGEQVQSNVAFQGKHLLAMGCDDYSHPQTRRVAKQIMRQSLAVQLGDKPLHSRNLFRKPKEE
ncbi:MAG: DNA repair protein RecO [Pseudomonadales bacterium]|nr:DNA repair protein RecO [Pseudomonadales bacterium]